MKKGSILTLVFMLTFGLLLAACGNNNDNGSGSSNGEDKSADTGESTDKGDSGDYVTKLTMGTGSTGGVYYPLGAELATVWNKNIDVDGFDVSSVESGASVENIAKISGGSFQLGIAQNTTAFNAVNGEGDFEGKKTSDFGVIASLYPEALTVVTLGKTGIDDISQLKGKKVAVGPPGGATRAAAEMVLKAYGIEKGDYKAYKEGFDDAKSKLQNGTIDAAISVVGIPSSATSELQAATKDVKLLSLNDDAVKMFTDNTPYVEYKMEAGTYEWQKEPVTTVTAMALLLASTDQVSEDLGYQLTKNLFEHAGDMSVPQAKLVTKDSALEGVKDLPLHPGAKKYFDEEGISE